MWEKWLKPGKLKTIRPSLGDYVGPTALLPPAPSMASENFYPNALNSGLNNLHNFAVQQGISQAQYYSDIMGAGQSGPSPLAVNVSVPLTVAARHRIDRVIDVLPFRALVRIQHISFVGEDPMRFVVYYEGGRLTEFADVDIFPSDEQIARILLDLA